MPIQLEPILHDLRIIETQARVLQGEFLKKMAADELVLVNVGIIKGLMAVMIQAMREE